MALELGPKPPEFDEGLSKLGEFAPELAEPAPISSISFQISPYSKKQQPSSSQSCTCSPKIGSSQDWPTTPKIGRNPSSVGRVRPWKAVSNNAIDPSPPPPTPVAHPEARLNPWARRNP